MGGVTPCFYPNPWVGKRTGITVLARTRPNCELGTFPAAALRVGSGIFPLNTSPVSAMTKRVCCRPVAPHIIASSSCSDERI